MAKKIPKREALFFLTLLIILVTSLIVWQMNRKDGVYKVGVNATSDKAVNTAKMLYDQQKRAKVDFSQGPCLSNALMDDWVADLVHVPRTAVDDDPDNQCIAYIEGGAHHFVELDLQGNVVRVK